MLASAWIIPLMATTLSGCNFFATFAVAQNPQESDAIPADAASLAIDDPSLCPLHAIETESVGQGKASSNAFRS